jgi:hypothetical protein
VKRWLTNHPRFVLHFTPTSSSWLNLVERWFADLTTKKPRRGTHTSVRQLNADIRAWIQTWNDNPRPYIWTKTADQILASIANYCSRISDSGHEAQNGVGSSAGSSSDPRVGCEGRNGSPKVVSPERSKSSTSRASSRGASHAKPARTIRECQVNPTGRFGVGLRCSRVLT